MGTVAALAALFGTQAPTSHSQARLLQDSGFSQDELKAFQTFVTRHNRNYLTKEEHSARLAIFKSNLNLVRAHDSVASGFKIGINQFSDMAVEEFERMQGFREIQELGSDVSKFL